MRATEENRREPGEEEEVEVEVGNGKEKQREKLHVYTPLIC